MLGLDSPKMLAFPKPLSMVHDEPILVLRLKSPPCYFGHTSSFEALVVCGQPLMRHDSSWSIQPVVRRADKLHLL